ncbi:O-antigen ligase family protein [Niallia sp. Marseille-Q9988]
MVDTPIGIISIPRFLLLVSLITSLILIVKYSNSIYLNKSDIIMYFFLILVVVNYSQLSSAFYFCLIIIGGYIVGRILKLLDKKVVLINAIKVAGIIQVVLVLYSMYINPFDFTAIEGRDVFKSLSNKIESSSSIRAAGTIGHPVVLGAVLVPSLLCWFAALINEKKKSLKILYLIVFFSTLYCIIITFSRGSWIAIFIVMIYLLYKKNHLRKMKTWIIMFCSLIILSVTPFGMKLIERVSSLSNTSDGSVSHRMYMYYWSFEEITRNPWTFLFGNGIGSTEKLLINNPPPDYFLVVDNTFLTFMVEMGIIGIILLFFILKKIIFARRNISIFNYIIIAWSIIGFTFDLYYWEQISILYWILVGYESTSINSVKKEGV